MASSGHRSCSAASEGGSVRGSPCGEPAQLRLTSLRPLSFGLLRYFGTCETENLEKRVGPLFLPDRRGRPVSRVQDRLVGPGGGLLPCPLHHPPLVFPPPLPPPP